LTLAGVGRTSVVVLISAGLVFGLAGCIPSTPEVHPVDPQAIAAREHISADLSATTTDFMTTDWVVAEGVNDSCSLGQNNSKVRDEFAWECWRSQVAVTARDDVVATLTEFHTRALAAGCEPHSNGKNPAGLLMALDYWHKFAGTDVRGDGDIYGADDLPAGRYLCDGTEAEIKVTTPGLVEDFELFGKIPGISKVAVDVQHIPVSAVDGLIRDALVIVRATRRYYTVDWGGAAAYGVDAA
jgi:hypothetical protein